MAPSRELFARHGALVEVAEIDADRAFGRGWRSRTLVARCGRTSVDVRDHAAVTAFAEEVLGAHGRVDVLVNNVGDYRPLVRFRESTPESWQEMYEVNLLHVFSVTHAFIGSMIDNRRGSIINVHSVEGMRGYPGEPVYGAMKAAVAHFTTCLAVGMGRHGIRVNGIGPDLTQTAQVDYLAGSGAERRLVGGVGANRTARVGRSTKPARRCSSPPTSPAS